VYGVEERDADREERLVYAWRRRQFLGLGFGRGEAQILAMGGADWHRARELLAAGCPHELVFRILT